MLVVFVTDRWTEILQGEIADRLMEPDKHTKNANII